MNDAQHCTLIQAERIKASNHAAVAEYLCKAAGDYSGGSKAARRTRSR